MARPIASISVDLDNQWSYMKSGAIDGWQDFPSYLEIAVPRMLAAFERRGLKLTVFVVGQDAALKKNEAMLRDIAAAGHEIGNHSFHHEPWLNRKPADEIAAELQAAHDAIASATGQSPVGFRGPGFSLSRDVLRAVAEMSYAYDASTFPTFVGPLARAYYFMTSGFDAKAREERAHLFGSVRDGLRSLDPYCWQIEGHALVELPVTTFPVFRLPFHFSYLAFAAQISPMLARTYFRSALLACRLRGVSPSFLLHPLDFLGAEDVPVLSGFPGMRLDTRTKAQLMDDVLDQFCDQFNAVGMAEHARHAGEKRLKARVPAFDVDAMSASGANFGAAQ